MQVTSKEAVLTMIVGIKFVDSVTAKVATKLLELLVMLKKKLSGKRI